MIDLLVLGGILELLWLAHTCPKDVPLGAVWRNYSHTGRLHSIDHRVVNMSRIMYFESQSHILVHHFELMDSFDLLHACVSDFTCSIFDHKEGILSRDSIAILWVWVKHSDCLLLNSKDV
jgi:hypothetical protein